MTTTAGTYKTLVFPSEKNTNGVYLPPFTRVYKPFDTIQFYHKGKFHTEAFREGNNIYLRRTTGELGALRYPWLFLGNFFCIAILTVLAVFGTYQVRVANHDNLDHAFLFSIIGGGLLFLLPSYTFIKHCIYPDAKEFSRWYHRDV
jgi:hypothetical protein